MIREDEATLGSFLRVVRRRKWIILLAALVVPASAVPVSLRQEPLFEASAQVLVSRQNLAKLGFVETGSELEEGYGCSGYSRYAPTPVDDQMAV